MANQKEAGFPFSVFTAFVVGTAAGIVAGMMTEKKNRDKVLTTAKELRDQARTRFGPGIEDAKVAVKSYASDIKNRTNRDKEKAKEEAEERLEDLVS